jgi:CheY-like chemotaxis protein
MMFYAERYPGETAQDIRVILVIEDDDDIGAFLREVFQTATPYCTILAKDSIQALKAAKAVIPDLFLLDYTLPGINGLELLDRFRSINELKQTPALLLSANVPEQEVEKRALPFIRKPFEMDALLQKIEELLAV